ncbi:hypothetical protein B0J17DRAFT_632046 [Rhizoctonia solani]|nr:hypothetical protein B0J17DRAFT_632046 [Rhizoctonia solani]
MASESINQLRTKQPKMTTSNPTREGMDNEVTIKINKNIATWLADTRNETGKAEVPAYLAQWAPEGKSLAWNFTSNTTPDEHGWETTIKRCETFHQSVEYARTLYPKAKLDYIPMAERNNCRWKGGLTLKCQKRGLLRWVGSEPPKTPYQMQKTKFFVCRRNVQAAVDSVVKAPVAKYPRNAEDWTWEVDSNDDGTWMVSITTLDKLASDKIDEWKRKIADRLGGYVEEYTPEEVYDMILDRQLGINNLFDWLKWRDNIHHLKDLGNKIAAPFLLI